MVNSLAKTYAEALIKAAQDSATSFDEILKELNEISETLKNSSELRYVLETPAVSTEQKISITNDIFKSNLSPVVLNFFKILIEKKRFNEFEQIIVSYIDKVDEIKGIKRVTVVSAIDLTDENKKKITDKLQSKLQKTIHASWQTDKDIIGGLIIKIDDDIIDTSVKNKLDNLTKIIIKGNL